MKVVFNPDLEFKLKEESVLYCYRLIFCILFII